MKSESRRESPQSYPDTLIIGRVLTPHGLRGEVRVEPLTDDASRFGSLAEVIIDDRSFRVRSVREQPGRVLMAFEGVPDVDTAASLRGEYVRIPREESLPLPEDAYYHFQLLGLRVETPNGELLGELREVMPLTANDVYVVDGPRGEVLIPALKDIVSEIDLSERRMTVNPIPGLLPWDEVP